MIKLERIHVLSQAEQLNPLRQFIRDLAILKKWSKDDVNAIVMAVNEACMNVIQHAYKNNESEEIIIEFWQDKQDVVIKIIDTADKVDVSLIKSRELNDVRPGGLGVHFIQQLMDEVDYTNSVNEIGNVLVMRKKLNA